MLLYSLKRIGLALVIIFFAMLVLFSLIHLIPGDPVSIALGPRATAEIQAKYAEKMGLTDPFIVQYLKFMWNALQGDLGNDVFTDRSVTVTVLSQMKFTVILALSGLGWAALLGIPLGCLSAVKRNSFLDRFTGVLSVGTIAIPSFVVSIWALLFFAVMFRVFPVIGAGKSGDLLDQLWHLILPAFAIGLGWVGYLARIVRASMLEVMGENYIRAAKAYGLPSSTVVYRYALKVAILPTVTLLGVGMGNLLSGAVFAEIIFARPGVGKLIVDMVLTRNFPVVQGAVLMTSILYVIVVTLTDLLAAGLDPRIRKSI
ncbi:MAG: ABC transporter permease [Pseudomonadota bacterium]|jgi:peptide/nickel transport system permease protein|nr:ABC transporter permease [Pseudomonadota bacterium]